MAGLSDKFYEQMIERAKSMTVDETRSALKKAGILDNDGKWVDRYQASQPATSQSQSD